MRALSVFDILFVLFKIAWWPSAEKDLAFPLVLFALCHLIVCVSFPFGVRGRMRNSFVADPCLSASRYT